MTEDRRGAYSGHIPPLPPEEAGDRLRAAVGRVQRRDPLVVRPAFDEDEDLPPPNLTEHWEPRRDEGHVPEFRPEVWHPEDWKSEADRRAEAAAEAARIRQERAGRYRPVAPLQPQDDFSAYQDEYPQEPLAYVAPKLPSRSQLWINRIGAGASVALVLALGYWGFDIAKREAHGVPIIRAPEGAMRVAPEDPGGSIMDHQGLAVNEVVAFGGATPSPDRLALAPAPIDLPPEDAPGLATELPPALPADEAVSNEPELELVQESPRPQETSAELAALIYDSGADSGVAAALAEALGEGDDFFVDSLENAGVESLDGATPLAPEVAPEAEPEPEPDPVVAEVPAAPPVPSLRPKARPENLAPPVAEAAAAPAVSVAVSDIPIGTKLVQFGAFDSADLAQAEWQKLQRRYPELIGSKQMVVQSAMSGGQEFWRLRAMGFSDDSDARRFCTVFDNDGIKCIPVDHR